MKDLPRSVSISSGWMVGFNWSILMVDTNVRKRARDVLIVHCWTAGCTPSETLRCIRKSSETNGRRSCSRKRLTSCVRKRRSRLVVPSVKQERAKAVPCVNECRICSMIRWPKLGFSPGAPISTTISWSRWWIKLIMVATKSTLGRILASACKRDSDETVTRSFPRSFQIIN